MNVTLAPYRQSSVTALFEDASHVFLWYKWVSAGTGDPAHGIGKQTFFVTGHMTGIWGNPGKVDFQPQAGGQTIAGGQVIFSTSKPATADRLAYEGRAFVIVSDPWKATINGTMYWRIEVKAG